MNQQQSIVRIIDTEPDATDPTRQDPRNAAALDRRNNLIGIGGTRVSVHEQFCRKGLDWGVVTAPVRIANDLAADGLPVVNFGGGIIPGRRIVVREDRMNCHGALGIVSDRYRPIQNLALADALDRGIHAAQQAGNAAAAGVGGAVSAGTWNGGRRIYCRLDLGGQNIAGCDPVRRHAIVTAAHDGTGSVKVTPVSIRLFCANQIPGIAKKGLRLRHTGTDLAAGIGRIVEALAAAAAEGAETWKRFEALAAAGVDSRWVSHYFHQNAARTLGPVGLAAFAAGEPAANAPAEDRRRWNHAHRQVMQRAAEFAERYHQIGSIGHQPGGIAPTLHGTRWHALQAVTESHEYAAGGTPESRTEGTNGSHKTAALDLAELVTV